MNSLSQARRLTTLKIAGLEIPECMLEGTVQAAINAFSRDTVSAKASRRRLVGKVEKIDAIETGAVAR